MPLAPPPLCFPEGRKKLLLHVCCAPCSGNMICRLQEEALPFSLFFYNPNIHPAEEYEKRKNEIKRYAERKGVPIIDADYDPDNWFSEIKGFEKEPERGHRCDLCFLMRLRRSAAYAHENGFDLLATSLAVSRWKNLDQVCAAAQQAVKAYNDLQFWSFNWRKNGGGEAADRVAKEENFYRQNYCGCLFSTRSATPLLR